MLGVPAIKWPDIVRVKCKKVLLLLGIFVVHPSRVIGDSLKELSGESNGHRSLGKDHWVAWMKEKAST